MAAPPPVIDPLREALNKITDWPAEGTSGGNAPRGDVVNLGTTVALENDVPPPAPDPFADELAALKVSNAELAAQLAPAAAAPIEPVATTSAVASAPKSQSYYNPYTKTSFTSTASPRNIVTGASGNYEYVYTPGTFKAGGSSTPNTGTPNTWTLQKI